MKKALFIGLGVLSLSIVSCKKDYTCTCTNTYTPNGGGTITTTTSTSQVTGADADQAQAACLEASIVTTQTNGTSERKCELSK